MIDEVLAANLTPAQRDAAVDRTAEVLALACAGSGKSRTLAYRIAYLLANGVDASGIVAFTFTEKAAEQIKRSIAKALRSAGLAPTLLGAMYVGTIHSYCQHILGAIDAAYRQFEVLDGNRLTLYLVSRYPSLGLNELRNRGVARRSYFDTIRKTADAWSTMNDEMVDLADVSRHDAALGRILTQLRDRLAADRYIDFSLMIRLVVEGLERGDERALEAISSLTHLMVDEYQDVNTSQERLIRQLHRNSESLFVVGDDDQSIYGWRGADVNNILTFRGRHPNSTQHTLGHNFRSTSAIVVSADRLAAAELGAQRIAKDPTADNPPGPRDFRVLWFDTRAEEAAWVAERISSLLGTSYVERDGQRRGLTPGDFAILMRSTRQPESNEAPRHAAFTAALAVRGIAYSLEAGGSPFDVAQVEVLRQTFGLLRNGSPSREEALRHFHQVVQPSYPQASFEDFAATMARWGREIHTPPGGARRRVFPQNLVHELLHAFGLQASNFGLDVMNALGLFSQMIQDAEAVYVSIDSANRFSELLNFLENVAEEGYDLSSDDLVQNPDAVTVSTVHKVKGLEFPVVLVVDVEEQRFPKNRRGYDGWLPAALIQDALNRGCYSSNANEEARLFYTALTRAERFLYVTGTANLPSARRARQRSRYSRQLVHPEISAAPDGLPAGLEPHARVPRIPEANLPTSFSEVRYYLRCPRDYQFRHRFGFAPAIVEMFGFGQTVHAAVGKLHEQFRNRAPTPVEAEAIAEGVFHLKHIPPSGDPVNRPGGYERAKESARRILRDYTETYGRDFLHTRQVEARFEILVERAVISGAIDLLLTQDERGETVDASVIDFKAMEGGDAPEENEDLDWTELALQVQLYAKAARDILGENATTGHVHLLKDNQRVEVPVDSPAVDAAVANVVWAVDRILAGDFPARPHAEKCEACDFKLLCSKLAGGYAIEQRPPAIYTAADGRTMVRSFSQFTPT